jgi:hypothetical protein
VITHVARRAELGGSGNAYLHEARVAAEELARAGLEQLVPGEVARVPVRLEDLERPRDLILVVVQWKERKIDDRGDDIFCPKELPACLHIKGQQTAVHIANFSHKLTWNALNCGGETL